MLSKPEHENPNTTKAVIQYDQGATKVSVAMIFEWRTSSVAKRWNDNAEEGTVLAVLALITPLPLLFAVESSDAIKVARRQHQHKACDEPPPSEIWNLKSSRGVLVLGKNNMGMRSAMQVWFFQRCRKLVPPVKMLIGTHLSEQHVTKRRRSPS